MSALEDQFAANPGSAPGGSGTTGLMSGDARGYSRMLEQQQEYLRLRGLLSGKGDPEIEIGGTTSTARPYAPTFDPTFQGSAVVGMSSPYGNGPADTPALSGLNKAAKRKR
jgi:hypothetical protein